MKWSKEEERSHTCTHEKELLFALMDGRTWKCMFCVTRAMSSCEIQPQESHVGTGSLLSAQTCLIWAWMLTSLGVRPRIACFSQHLDCHINNNQDQTEVVSFASLNTSVFLKSSLAWTPVQTGVIMFSVWYGTLKLLMSSYFSRALVAWLLLFSCYPTWCKYRPPVLFKPSLSAAQGLCMLAFLWVST